MREKHSRLNEAMLPTSISESPSTASTLPNSTCSKSTALPRTTGEATALGVNAPSNPISKVRALGAAVVNNLRPADPRHHAVPQANYPPIEARWFSLGRVDGVTVTTADGRGVVYRQRDRDIAAALLRESVTLQRQVKARFDEMRSTYRAAAADLTSTESWEHVFAQE